MQTQVLFLSSMFLLSNSTYGGSSLVLSNAPTKPATYADMHRLQALGRIIAAPDGTFILYEWGRPYLNWVPPSNGIAPVASRRLQTFLFKVDVTTDMPVSEYLVEPNAGATYWLGDLSPDSSGVVFYELDRDDNRTRAAMWSLKEQRITWFDLPADEGRLDEVTSWISNEEFTYPIKGRVRFARANVSTGKAIACTDCDVKKAEKGEARKLVTKIDTTDLPQGAVLRAVSESDNLSVFVKDDSEVLSLLIKQPGWDAYEVFTNSRNWPRRTSNRKQN